MIYKNLFFKKYNLNDIINVLNFKIDRVGIKNYYHPFIYDNNRGKLLKSFGLWNLSVSLFKTKRGAHMSRFIFILNRLLIKPFNLKSFLKFHKIFSKLLWAKNLFIQISFIYFLKKISPLSKNKCLLNYKITFLLKKINIMLNFIIKFFIPISSLCPCSKIISRFNAHNQRSYVTLFLFIENFKNFYLNNIIQIIENDSSSSLWSILKRNDEKYFTEFSYKNPNFIEDITRKLCFQFSRFNFILKIENIESIHNHDVYSFSKNF